jgi:hypothetical protein
MDKTKIIILFISIFILLTSLFNKNGPILSLDKELHDYGVIDYGSNGNSEFIIKNTGNKILVISDIKSNCGCTIVNSRKKTIEPGDSSVIRVKYDTKRPGAINKKIFIISNDIYNPEKTIWLKGYVKSPN